ncbi:MAG: RNA polymerase sigma factor [Acidimicrobiia bacterium]
MDRKRLSILPDDPDTPEVRGGEPFESYVRRDGKRLVGLAYTLCGSRAAADDLVQDTLLAAYQNWEVVSRMDNPGAWVRRVLANRSVSVVRRRISEARGLARLALDWEVSVLPEVSAETQWIWREVRRLPRRQAQVTALHYFDQFSMSEIAEILECSKTTVNTHLRRARDTLSRRLSSLGGTYEDA